MVQVQNINWNLPNSIIQSAFETVVEEFAAEQINQIETVKWNWDGTTHRKSGEVVSSPRNIVDLGNLRDSLSVEYLDATEVNYSYPVDYAAAVHEGAVYSSGREMPARPWVDSAIASYPIAERFADEVRRKI